MKMRQIICAILVLSIVTVSGAGVMAYTTHAPIRIDSNNDFSTYASSGDGTAANPWNITGLEIDGAGYGYCIYIGNTTDYFIIQDCYLYNAYTSSPDNYYRTNSGISFYYVENGVIDGNEMLYNDFSGVFIYGSSDIIIENNIVYYNQFGIYVLESDYNIIQYNEVSLNTCYGITMDYSNYNHIYRNTVEYNDIGIHLFYCASMNAVEDNLVFYNDYGLIIFWSSYNTVLLNSFCLNSEYGVYIDIYSSNNDIIYNNFGNNINQAYDAGTGNNWHAGFSNGGNYWTDHDPVDLYSGPQQNQPGSDGIVDNPYLDIDGGDSKDKYPLVASMDTYGIGQREDPNGIGQREDPN